MFKPDRDTSDQRIAERIRMLMKHRKLSMRKLSDDTGLPYRTVQNYLTGKVALPVSFIVKCCDALTIEADILLFGGVDIDKFSLLHAIEDIIGKDITDALFLDENRKVRARTSPTTSDDTPNSATAMRNTILLHLAEYIHRRYVHHRTDDAWAGKGYVSPADADNARLARLGLFPRD